MNTNTTTKEQWIWFALREHCDSVEVLTCVYAACVGGRATCLKSNDLSLKIFYNFKIADIFTAGTFNKSSIFIAIWIGFSSCLACWMTRKTFWSAFFSIFKLKPTENIWLKWVVSNQSLDSLKISFGRCKVLIRCIQSCQRIRWCSICGTDEKQK